ncbi:molybdopterin-dependent oxidoreductase [Sandarakinorhabdus sp.]|uniref:molybdopterin-dependent oxidoreductase n=1 Tax=Sandarakinorhabdus sp. TaxID=1916663 RepID=UPI00286DBC36|nr:molybdopterin-dependent oxidoreductase [Sandarakinorhabdus sp.]
MTTRRQFLALTATGLAAPALAQKSVDLGLAGGAPTRALTRDFPQKGEMILQRSNPPLLETPFDVFKTGTITPNDRFFVRWHYPFPTDIDPRRHRVAVTGHVARPLSLSLAAIARLPRIRYAAVNQCAGNGRALFSPRVAGAGWANGAMGNAVWEGVRLKDVLDLAGVKPGAVCVRVSGLDAPTAEGAPDFAKSLAIDHARDGEVMLAFAMNGVALPLLNGFPLRLVVPGWYSTYWVKMLDSIEVLDRPDDGYWMTRAYLAPATPFADVAPGTAGFARVPVAAMSPRAFITNIAAGARLPRRSLHPVQGLAMGGDSGVRGVELSGDGGRSWAPAQLGPDEGRYGFRRFMGAVAAAPGSARLMARATNMAGVSQPMRQNWNPSGYNRAGVEAVAVEII